MMLLWKLLISKCMLANSPGTVAEGLIGLCKLLILPVLLGTQDNV